MSRYGRYDYEDRGGRGRSADPNYRGEYGGMRMLGEGRGAPYGWHRLMHAGDLEEFGGFRGYGEPRVRARFHGYDRDLRGYDDRDGYRAGRGGREFGGGVARSLYDREYLRDFNSHSPALRGRARPGGVFTDR
jgi:hypothetical protein